MNKRKIQIAFHVKKHIECIYNCIYIRIYDGLNKNIALARLLDFIRFPMRYDFPWPILFNENDIILGIEKSYRIGMAEFPYLYTINKALIFCRNQIKITYYEIPIEFLSMNISKEFCRRWNLIRRTTVLRDSYPYEANFMYVVANFM